MVNATRETYCTGQVDDTVSRLFVSLDVTSLMLAKKPDSETFLFSPIPMEWVRDCFSHIATLPASGIRTQEPAVPCSNYCTWNDNCPFSVGSRPESSGRLDQQCYWDVTALGI